MAKEPETLEIRVHDRFIVNPETYRGGKERVIVSPIFIVRAYFTRDELLTRMHFALPPPSVCDESFSSNYALKRA